VFLTTPARRLELRAIAAARHVFVLSETGAEAVCRELSPRSSAVTVLPYPVNRALSGTADDGHRATSGLVVGFFGHWYPSKNIEDLVEALALLRDERPLVRARLLGDALVSSTPAVTRQYRDAIVELVHRRGLGDTVSFHGHIPDDDVPGTLAACDVIVLPYAVPHSVTGLSSTSAAAHDALTSRTPVITTRSRGLPDLIRHGENGLLFAPGDVRGLAEQLRALRDDEALLRRLRKGASRSADALLAADPGAIAVSVYAELAVSRLRRP
jgi:glycosyltransferase involved in cell wall biosynthesis